MAIFGILATNQLNRIRCRVIWRIYKPFLECAEIGFVLTMYLRFCINFIFK